MHESLARNNMFILRISEGYDIDSMLIPSVILTIVNKFLQMKLQDRFGLTKVPFISWYGVVP